MKKSVVTFIAIVLVIIVLHAFRAMKQPTITGKIYPGNAATSVWAINGSQLVKVTPQNGEFRFAVPPGNWKVMVEAHQPFESHRMPAAVVEGQTLDLGVINLY